MSQHSEPYCKHEQDSPIYVEDTSLSKGCLDDEVEKNKDNPNLLCPDVEKNQIASEWDENDLELCIINSQEEQSSMSEPGENKGKEKVSKAQWSGHTEEILFNVLRKYIEGEQVTKKAWNVECLRKSDWKVVTAEFNRVSGLEMTLEQVTAKKKRWKQQWIVYNKLKKETGLGWSVENNTFRVENWADLEKKIAGASLLKGKQVALFDQFHLIFADDSADPTRGFSNLSQPLFQSSQNGDFIDLDDDVSPNSGTPVGRKRYASPDASGSMRSRKSSKTSKDDELASAMHSINSTMKQVSVVQQAMQEFCRMGFSKDDMLRFHKHLSGEERFTNAEKWLAVNEEWRRAIVESLI